MQERQDLRNISIGKVQVSNGLQNFARLDQKWRKFWDFLIKISMENWLFSQFSTKYFLKFCLLSERIYPRKLTLDFYNDFSYFWGNLPALPLPPPSRRYWQSYFEPEKTDPQTFIWFFSTNTLQKLSSKSRNKN